MPSSGLRRGEGGVVLPPPGLPRRGGLLERRHDRPQMRARGLLGHAPAIPRVEVGLRGDDIGLDDGPVADNGYGRFVAAGFDAEDARHIGGISKTRTPEATNPYRRWPSGLDWISRTPASAGSRNWRTRLPSARVCRMRACAGSARNRPPARSLVIAAIGVCRPSGGHTSIWSCVPSGSNRCSVPSSMRRMNASGPPRILETRSKASPGWDVPSSSTRGGSPVRGLPNAYCLSRRAPLSRTYRSPEASDPSAPRSLHAALPCSGRTLNARLRVT